MVSQWVETVAALVRIEAETGRRITLALEPEPDCFLETTDDVILLFESLLLPSGSRQLAERLCIQPAQAEVLIRRHMGVCFDTCHLALQFEDLESSLVRLAGAGIGVAKVQLSAALRAQPDTSRVSALARFCDPVYLHQVKVRTGQGVRSLGDLPAALAGWKDGNEARGEWRIHCHVPLDFTGAEGLESTADAITPGFLRRALDLGVTHFEMETYTFDVLPPELRRGGVMENIVREYDWCRARWPG
jgi:hypothetical protein